MKYIIMEIIKNLWVSGYRSYELGIFQKDDPKEKVIKDLLEQELINYCENGLQWVLTGGQLGIDQFVVGAVQELKKQEYELKVAVMMPFMNMQSRWNEKNQEIFMNNLEKADYHNYVSQQDYSSPGQFKIWQQFMLQHTNGALFVYDEEHPGKSKYEVDAIKQYQEQNDYDFQTIDFYDLQDFVDSQQDS